MERDVSFSIALHGFGEIHGGQLSLCWEPVFYFSSVIWKLRAQLDAKLSFTEPRLCALEVFRALRRDSERKKLRCVKDRKDVFLQLRVTIIIEENCSNFLFADSLLNRYFNTFFRDAFIFRSRTCHHFPSVLKLNKTQIISKWSLSFYLFIFVISNQNSPPMRAST